MDDTDEATDSVDVDAPLVPKPATLRQPPDVRAYTETDLAAKAAGLDCDLVVGDDRTLLLDLDNQQALDTYVRNLVMFYEQYAATRTEKWESRHGRTHMVIHLSDPIPDVATRLLLQATLGSDPTRELATWRDYSRGFRTPNVLFKPRVVSVAVEVPVPATEDTDGDLPL